MTLLEKRRNLHRKELRSGDYLVVMLTMMLVIFGVVMVFSASYYTALKDYGDPYYFFKKEIMFVLVGTVLMLFVAIVDYHIYREFSYIIIAASLFCCF
ncbi:MAG: FtsW/RodA/SpoVE family cell cycle protein [Clostridiales bacterium]|nr:FtsW/RodA/SpoVE family cell cycle protein [Clostridiales bacterium]